MGRSRAVRGQATRRMPANARWASSASASAAMKPSSASGSKPSSHHAPSDPQRAGRAVDPRLDPADEAIAVQDRQDVVAPAALGLRDVDLPDVVEVEARPQELAVPGERVERRDQGDARRLPLGRAPAPELPIGLAEQAGLLGHDEPAGPDTLDLDRDEGPGRHELVEQG